MITVGRKASMNDFAREKRHGIPRDNLTLDAMDAEAAGMSYGNFKAMHPKTKDANEARLDALNKRPHREKKPYTFRNVYALRCAVCDRVFESGNKARRYCSDECKAKHDGARWRASKRAKEKKTEE